VTIVDFGFVSKYTDKKSGEHLKVKYVDLFRGNFLFASQNQLDFKLTSRRDDLISLFYLLVYLLHDGHIPKLQILIKGRIHAKVIEEVL